MECKVSADSIRYLVATGMAGEIASEILRLEAENRRLRKIGTELRKMVVGDHHWTIAWEHEVPAAKDGKPTEL